MSIGAVIENLSHILLNKSKSNLQEISKVTALTTLVIIFLCVLITLGTLIIVGYDTKFNYKNLSLKDRKRIKFIRDILGTVCIGVVVGIFNNSMLFAIVKPVYIYGLIIGVFVLYGLVTWGAIAIEK